MVKISDGVYFIEGQDEFIPDSHTYILGHSSSQDLSLVDPGLTRKGSYKLDSIKKMGIKLEHIKRVIMTHTHLDHIGCFPEIQKKIPSAELWVHLEEADALEQGDERTVYGMDMFRQMCQTQYGLKSGDYTLRVARKLRDGEGLEVGGMAWEVLHIPGHSRGSIALYDRSQKILIPGDVVYADYAIGRFDLHGSNGKELQKSLLKLAELDVKTLLPGHNQVVNDVLPGYIRKTAGQWKSYLT